jgi:uncharacterized protein YjbI with pentapeptide repeats
MDADEVLRRLVSGADLHRTAFPPYDEYGMDVRGADLRELRSRVPSPERINLRGADLSGLDLRRRYLGGADFTGADLSSVNVDHGSFDGAVLDGADLDGAVLTFCTLRDASLVGASLVRADLREATLTSADLRGANLTDALLPGDSRSPYRPLGDPDVRSERIDISVFGGARFDSSTQWSENVRAQAVANSVAGPDGTHVINSPPTPAPPTPAPPTPPPARRPRRIWSLLGRVIMFLFGAALTVGAVLTVTGDFLWEDSAGEPTTNIFVRILLGLVYGVWGLGLMGKAIWEFDEGPATA